MKSLQRTGSKALSLPLASTNRRYTYSRSKFDLVTLSIVTPMRTLAAAISGMARSRVRSAVRTRSGDGDGAARWTSPGTDKGKAYFLNRTPLAPGESRKWEDWELPCYVTSFLTIVILGVGLNAKPDLTIETWAHEKALERLREKEMATAGESE